jgi:hypothetical protein
LSEPGLKELTKLLKWSFQEENLCIGIPEIDLTTTKIRNV